MTQPGPTPSCSAADIDALKALAGDYAVSTSDASSHAQYEAISKLLLRIREAFRMDVVFVSEFVGGRRVFRHADAAPHLRGLVTPGQSDPLERSVCQRIVDGRMPRAIPDARQDAEASKFPETQHVPIGGHLSVPIVLPGGQVFGTLCCFSREAKPGLGDADVKTLEAIAELIAAGIDRQGGLRSPLLVRDI